ncbi:MAG: hypothetical protein QOE82_1099 [Thermoanaerobaculia bacterium]|jgi:hypothetical protein|nr:hypothetical protein [Thermoanaerobaculia bacterium]
MPSGNPFGEGRGRYILLGCIGVFMLPFIASGVGLLSVGIRALQRHEANAIAPLLAGFFFTAFSVSIFAVVLVATRNAARDAALRARTPDQPWMWRPEWSARRIPDRRRASAVFLWIFAIFWNAITIPVSFLIVREWTKQHNPALFIALIFPAVGLGLIIAAIYTGLRRLKFGVSICTIDSVPIHRGHSFHGEIEMRGDAIPDDGYRLKLVCVRRVVTGSGKNQSVSETPLAEQEIRVSTASAMRLPTGGVRIPFSMTVPSNGPSCDLRNARDQILWRLEAAAEMPGIDYAASFELPVFE